MKILIATGIFPPEIGGPATYAGLLAEELPKRGFETDVLAFRTVRSYPRVVRHFMYFLKVLSRSRKSDAIFTQDPVSTGIPVVCAAFFTRKPVVMRVAGDYAWEQSRQRYGVTDSIDDFQKKRYSFKVQFLRSLQAFAVRHADIVITPSEYFNRLVSGWNRGRKKVTTIYNGIRLIDDFEKGPKYSQKTMITAGRLVPWKGFDVLIRALKRMPEWTLVIAGDGPDRKRLDAIVEECDAAGRVEFLGNITREALFSKIYRSHVFVLLSTFESFSFQIVEALHIGTPVVAADIGNLSEIIDNGVDGLLIPPTDVDSLVKFADKVVSDGAYAASFSAAGKKKAQKFSVERTLDRLSEAFRSFEPS